MPSETFFVRLFNPKNGATISSPTYLTVHIEGQSVPGLIGFDSSDLIIAENESDFSIDVYRTAGKDGEVSVDYSIIPATINEDLENISGTLTWADGDTDKKTIIIPLINDDDFESDEAFKISLSAISNAKLASNYTINIVIKDDENNKPPTITIAEILK
ncbi:Calx-beta domain-containing protein [Psychrobium sp. nBUS_13]|uniref:Calx-beta domain-containing protein n=1 Tax=Psychrobium sp. nBUS_13 TaxID=3395319 RepID=UPI003EB900D0